MRLDDAICYFLGQWPAEGAGLGTVRTYSRQLKWLAGFAAGRRKVLLADLSPELLRAAMAAKLAQTTGMDGFKGGEAAAHSLAFAARCMARWLRAQGVPVADLTTVKPRKPPERVQPRLYPHEFEALEQAVLRRLVEHRTRTPRNMIARDLALIYMLAETGLRASEVCAMDVRSVDFELGAVLVVRGKGNKERALSIVDPDDPRGGTALQLIADWLEARATISNASRHTRLWVSAKGWPLTPDSLRYVLERMCRDAGLSDNRPPHSFRRMNFTESYKAAPASIRVLADRMGWSPKNDHMVNVYIRGAQVDLARTMPIPSVVARWRTGPVTSTNIRTLPPVGVGSPRVTQNGPSAPFRVRVDAPRAALSNPREVSRRPSG